MPNLRLLGVNFDTIGFGDELSSTAGLFLWAFPVGEWQVHDGVYCIQGLCVCAFDGGASGGPKPESRYTPVLFGLFLIF